MTFQFPPPSAVPSLTARSPAVSPHLKIAWKMIKGLSLLTALLAVSCSAIAENASIVGTWTLAAADKILPDGSRVPDYGPKVTPRQDGSVPITVLRRLQ